MKNSVVVILIILLGIGCTKETDQHKSLLSRITLNGKTYEAFEYNSSGRLSTDKFYGMCDQNPSDEYVYLYKANRVDTLKSVVRSIYSSTTAICNPATGIRSIVLFEYDAQGRTTKIKRDNSVITFVYNAKGLIEKQINTASSGASLTSTYKYDSRDNLVEQNDGQGNISSYEFDNKINPYYLIKHNPHIITAFIVSPNNVVKVNYSGGSHLISYEYNSAGLPVKMLDSNGQTYLFEYK